jgi:hypothetical protein
MDYNNLFEAELKKLVSAEIERLKDNLANGASVVDYADYKNQVGKITGLRMTIDLCEEVETILAKR